jgi:alcohol dehydrogenase
MGWTKFFRLWRKTKQFCPPNVFRRNTLDRISLVLRVMTSSTHVDFKHGEGSGKELPVFLEEKGYKRIGVVVDTALKENKYFNELLKFLGDKVEIVHRFVNDMSDPTYEHLDSATDEFRKFQPLDCVIAIGGGSTLDLAKGISVLLTNPGPGVTYKGLNNIKVAGVPYIMIPTTAGTGSEVTPNASFTDTQLKKKQGISTSFYHPALVILDPALVASCPKSVTIAAAMDALVHHAIDAYISGGKDNPLCSLFAKKAVSLFWDALPKVLENPQDLKLRSDTQLGALYAGLALTNGGGGSIAGAASYPLGLHFKIPHGTAIAILALEVVRFNEERGFKGYEDFMPDFYKEFSKFCAKLDVPRLSDFGIKEKDLSLLAEETSAMPVTNKNPIPATKEDIHSIFKACL